MPSFFYWFFIIVALTFAVSLKILKEDERLVVIRLGRFLKVVGPGLVWILPFIDRGIRVNLRESIPGWEGLSKAELDEKTRSFVLNKI
jgi:regulator of protease activity HflC (stomatin/prohibitin superfamily)